MRAYLTIIDGKVDPNCGTSLKLVCGDLGVSYNSAVRGKRFWFSGGVRKEIIELSITKIMGRGRK